MTKLAHAIETLDIEKTPVDFILHGGQVVRGFMKFMRDKRVYRPVISLAGSGAKLYPTHWLPPANKSWPCHLPPLVPVEENRHATGSGFEDIGDEEDQERRLHPDIVLGWPKDPPQSVEETEERVFRCLRTYEVTVRSDIRVKRNAWGQNLRDGIEMLERALHSATDPTTYIPRECLDQYHIDKSKLDPLKKKKKFNLTNRDIADAEAMILNEWGKNVTAEEWKLFALRADFRDFSWPEITLEMRRYGFNASRETWRRKYKDACVKIFEGATRGANAKSV
jgi:hypothetical protein